MTPLDSINGWSIQMLLKGGGGGNDSQQSDEIQATSRYILRKPKGVQSVDSYNNLLYSIWGVTTTNTHLSFHLWCSIIVYCKRWLFKRWITLYPSRQNIIQWIVQLVFLINTYPLNLVNSVVIHLLNNHEKLCSTWVTMMVGKFACTCWQIIIIRTY